MPVVSVIIPTYNTGQYLGDAIRSVLDQTYEDIEIIVVDDGSTDQTSEIVAQFEAEPRLRYMYQSNQGRSAARNTGIRASLGQFIAFLDADDMWSPDKLESQVKVILSNPAVHIVYSEFSLVDIELNPIETVRNTTKSRGLMLEDLMLGNVISGSASSVLIRSECFEAVGLFDESLETCEDQDLWRRLAMHFDFYCIQQEQVLIRVHESQAQMNLEKMTRGRIRHLEKILLDTPPEFRYLFPEVSYITYRDLGLYSLKMRKMGRAISFAIKLIALGPKYVLRLGNDIGRSVLDKLSRRIK